MKRNLMRRRMESSLRLPVQTVRRLLSVILSVSMVLGGMPGTMPVLAEESQLDCQFQVHEHDDSCYEKKLICDKEENEQHHHTEDCYEKVLNCGRADYVVHTHDARCYDESGNLICKLPEVEVHEHTDECYANERVLDCDKDHEHDDSCYKIERTLICHKPVITLHTHNKDCYDEDGKLICGKLEVVEHQHSDECFKQDEEEEASDDEDPDIEEPVEEPADNVQPDEEQHPQEPVEEPADNEQSEEKKDAEDPVEQEPVDNEQSEEQPVVPGNLKAEMQPLKARARNSQPTSAIINEFKITFSRGGTLNDEGPVYKWNEKTKSYEEVDNQSAYIWNPSDPVKEHQFIYRLDYSVSGTFESKGLEFTLPLHILKDREGNWADTFECPYVLEGQEGSNVDFAYRINEEKGTVTIFSVKEIPAGAKGYIEVAWTTTDTTMDYFDMGISTSVDGTVQATGSDGETREKSASALPVGIDTHATISSTSKHSNPSYYDSWQSGWGIEKPEDAEESYYLIWTIYTTINKNTSPYTFKLNDTFTSLGGSVVGYKFAGQSQFSAIDHVDGVTGYGGRYDYVLVRYSKAQADELLKSSDRYEVRNDIEAIVDPVDQVDADTNAFSNASWIYEVPKYIHPTGHFWAEKYGLYPANGSNYVRSSNDVSGYSLAEFNDDQTETIPGLRYEVYVSGYPYPWTADESLTDTEDDVKKYGKVPVDYHLVDDHFELEDGLLQPADYDVSVLDWTLSMSDARYDSNSKQFVGIPVTYTDTDIITFSVKKDDSDQFTKALTYNLKSGNYDIDDSSVVASASGRKIQFNKGVKGYRVDLSNAHYYTEFTAYPTITLNRTNHTLELIDPAMSQGEFQKVAITNKATGSVTQQENTLFTRDVEGRDYVQAVVRNGQLKKDVTSTRNDKVNRLYHVGWNSDLRETYRDDAGLHYVPQSSGVFYDLLPAGSVLEQDTIVVRKGSTVIDPGYYDVETIDNYRSSGRTMLIVRISTNTDTNYSLAYTTTFSWNAMQDYGKRIHNSVAYETGNEDIADGLGDTGGSIQDKELMKDLDPAVSDTDKKFLYAQATYDVNALLAADTGLTKKVRGGDDLNYSYESFTTNNGSYSYQVRLANDANSKAQDIVFFDSLENFYQSDSDELKIPSDWHGMLTGIDVSQLRSKGINVKVYVSTQESLNINHNHDLQDSTVWTLITDDTDLSGIRAVAVDARKTTDNKDYILDAGESLAFTLYMRAPATESSVSSEPTAYNNIYVESRSLSEEGEPSERSLYHQDYTKISYRISGDVQFEKVNAKDESEKVSNVIYELSGTSQYGTVYNLRRATNANGQFSFKNIEKGKYTVKEVESNPDWLLSEDVYTVEINEAGQAVVNGVPQEANAPFVVKDLPRVHGDLSFLKTNSITDQMVEGAVFRLMGTSDYGNDVLKYSTSNKSGLVSFTDIELGTYTLTETETPEGYVPNQTTYTVKVDEWGVVSISLNGQVLDLDLNGYYRIGNEPKHSITFLKKSSYGTGLYLEGAEFTLTGTSDLGTEVNMTAKSGNQDNLGRVTFEGLEPGVYELKETKAPTDENGTTFNLDETVHTVVVKSDGSYTITGLEQDENNNFVYVFSDVPDKGMIVITKRWEDDLEDEERNKVENIPDIEITTDKPEGDGKAYKVTFDATDGVFEDGSKQNQVLYTSDSRLLKGTYKAPNIKSDTITFTSWVDDKNNEYQVDTSGNLDKPINRDLTLKAVWSETRLIRGDWFDEILLTYKVNNNTSAVTAVSIGTRQMIPTDKEVKPWMISRKDNYLNVNGLSENYLLDVSEKQDGSIVAWVEGTTVYVEAMNNKKVVFNPYSGKMFCSDSNFRITVGGVQYNGTYRHSIKNITFGPQIDTSKVTNMGNMFCNCSGLTSLDLRSFDTSNVTYMGYMFYDCKGLKSLDLSSLDTSKVTGMDYMFYGCRGLTSLDLRSFDTSNVTDMTKMFFDCSGLTSLDLSSFDTSKVTNMGYMFKSCSGLTSLDLRSFDTSNVTDMGDMFFYCIGLTSLELSSSFDTSKVTDMVRMFYCCRGLTSLDLSSFDTSKVTDMGYMFYGCRGLTSLDLSRFDTSKVTSMAGMFEECSGLTSLDLRSFDTSNVTYMNSMFNECSGLTSLDLSSLHTSNAKNMSDMFNECSGLTSLDLSSLDTSKVTSMGNMFRSCSGLTSLDLSSFDTSNVTSMGSMFNSCSGLTSLDLSSFDTSNVTNMGYMFYGCRGLTSLDLRSFDTSKVTSMAGMFEECSGLTSLDLRSFDTSKVTSMAGMFEECSGLTSLDLRSFDTSNVTNMGYMFYKCRGLTSLDLSSLDTSNVTDMRLLFCGCNSLHTIYAGDWTPKDGRSVNSDSMFFNCYSLVGQSSSGGVAYNVDRIDITMAKPAPDGYFTDPALKPAE